MMHAKETIAINQSLRSLQIVMSQLRQPGSFVSYRDDTLTSQLKNSLTAQTISISLICTVSLDTINETKRTFEFAHTVKGIISQPCVNVIEITPLAAQIREQVDELLQDKESTVQDSMVQQRINILT